MSEDALPERDGLPPDEDPADESSGEEDPETGVDAGELPAGATLTENQLEALLFVAERPLSRRDIGTIAGVDRATVDERLGDLEVTLADRGIRLACPVTAWSW